MSKKEKKQDILSTSRKKKKKLFFSYFSSRITPETHGWCGPDAVVACLPCGIALREQARKGKASPWQLPYGPKPLPGLFFIF